jgi:small conductance mechanosensitive channel
MLKVDPLTVDLNALANAKATLLDMAIRFGPKLLVALLILSVGFLAGRWVARSLNRALLRFDLEPPVRLLLSRLARMLVLLLFMMIALQNLGVELLPLIAGMGVVGAGLALATQGVLSNVIAGLTIIFTKPYRVGEYIAIVGVDGRVETISVFNTELMRGDRSRVVIPNRKIVGEILHNYGRIRQSEVLVGVAYDTNLLQALDVIGHVVRAHPKVLTDPAPVVQVVKIGPSAVQIAVRPWLNMADLGNVEGELIISILDALKQRAIVIPFPQQEIRMVGNQR